MSKILQILKNHPTEERLEYEALLTKEIPKDKIEKLLHQSRLMVCKEICSKQAKRVLNGECPHEYNKIGDKFMNVSPRDWMSWTEEVGVYSPCKFCGEKV